MGSKAAVSPKLAKLPDGLAYVRWAPVTVSITVIVYWTLVNAPAKIQNPLPIARASRALTMISTLSLSKNQK